VNINFNTDNLVISSYPRFAGGKFLVNCLGLSDDAVFQDAILADKQLEGTFNNSDKIDYIMNALDNHRYDTSKLWNDLKLGCVQLFSSTEIDYSPYKKVNLEWEKPYIAAAKIVTVRGVTLKLNDTVDRLSHNRYKFFIGSHVINNLTNMLTVWSNAKIIAFKNTTNFRRLRAGTFYSENEKLDSITLWDNELSEFLSDKELDVYWFDNNLYFSEERTINEISKLYTWLNLSGFDEAAISTYYRRWIKTCLPIDLIKLRNS